MVTTHIVFVSCGGDVARGIVRGHKQPGGTHMGGQRGKGLVL